MPDPPILNYAGPRLDAGLPEIHTDGRTDLYIRKPIARGEGTELPRRCVVCNGRVKVPSRTVRLNYVDPAIRQSYRGGIMFYWIYLLVLIVRGIHERSVRQSVRLTYSVCPAHRSNRSQVLIFRWVLLIACTAIMPAAGRLGLGDSAAFISCVGIVLNVLWPWPKRQLRIDRMTATHAVITGPSREFLQSLRQTL